MAFKGNIFFIADLHFGHAKLVRPDEKGETYRPWDSTEEMDQALVDNWNSVVKEGDKVYVLGDLSMNPKKFVKIDQCKGRKHLIKGNHDVADLKDYASVFYNVSACWVFDKQFIATHIPIHPGQLDRFHYNVHGHLHKELLPDRRYVNVSVENIDYRPVHMDEILSYIERHKNSPWQRLKRTLTRKKNA